MILLAILLPPVAMFLKGRPIQALLCLLLMVTLIGWIPAAIWAVAVVNGANADARMKRLEKTIKKSQQQNRKRTSGVSTVAHAPGRLTADWRLVTVGGPYLLT